MDSETVSKLCKQAALDTPREAYIIQTLACPSCHRELGIILVDDRCGHCGQAIKEPKGWG